MPETSYAQCGDLSLAYQVFGDGDAELVFAGSFVSHVELAWTMPETKAWFDQLRSFCRILLFDKAGVGLSDPVPRVRSIDDRAAEIEAVMEAAGFKRAVIMGVSEGGPAAIVFAAARPDRVKGLILAGTFPWFGLSGWDDVDRDPQELHAGILAELGDRYTPSPQQLARMQAFCRAVRSRWGSGEAITELLPSVHSVQQLGTLERMSASPGMARATVEAIFRIDVRAVLAAINVPTLVIHAVDDAVPVQGGRFLADHIPGAEIVELQSADHAPWFADPDQTAARMEQFLTGTRGAPPHGDRALRTVLFSDMVASTDRAATMGDARWRAVLERFGAITTQLVERFGGVVVKSTGDGHLATFDRPTQAIRGAEALRAEAASIDIAIRAGVHTGECEIMGDDIAGIAVHIAARVMAMAGAGEILVSSAVRDLVVGSGIGFEERGVHELRGVPGHWQILAVDPRGAQPGSPEAALIALPTPAPSSAMRRSDRAVAAMARHAPWLLRGTARLTSSGSR